MVKYAKLASFFSRKRQGALGGDRSFEQASGFGTCRPTATNTQKKDSNTTTPKPRQQELQKLSNSATFGEMVRQRFARSCFSGAGTYFGKSHPTKASPKFRHGSLKNHFLFYFQFFLLRWTLIKKRCVRKNEDWQIRIQSQRVEAQNDLLMRNVLGCSSQFKKKSKKMVPLVFPSFHSPPNSLRDPLCQRPCHNGSLRCLNNSGRNLQVAPDPALCTINPYSASRS